MESNDRFMHVTMCIIEVRNINWKVLWLCGKKINITEELHVDRYHVSSALQQRAKMLV